MICTYTYLYTYTKKALANSLIYQFTMTEYTKYISEPWFTLIKLGIKKCEGRLNKGDFSIMDRGDIIIFTNIDFNFKRSCKVEIKFRRCMIHLQIYYDRKA